MSISVEGWEKGGEISFEEMINKKSRGGGLVVFILMGVLLLIILFFIVFGMIIDIWNILYFFLKINF